MNREAAPTPWAELRTLGRGPRQVGLLLALTLFVSGIVKAEPAPTDALAAAFVPLAFLAGRPAVHARLTLPLVSMFLLVLSNLVSVFLAPDPGSTLRFLAISLYLFAFWTALSLVVTRHGRTLAQVALSSYSLGIGLSALVALTIYLAVPGMSALVAPKARLGGFFKDSNVFGAAVVPAIAYAIAAASETGRRRTLWGLLAAACAIASILSYSRGSWVNAAVTLTAMYGLRVLGSRGRATFRTLASFFLAMAILAPLLWWVVQLPAVQEMMEIRLRYQKYDDNRFGTQFEAFMAAVEYPLGIGPGVSESAFSRATHSLYVRALIENGLIGFLAMISLLLASLVRISWSALVERDEQTRLVMAVIAGSLWGLTAESFVIDTVHWRHFWFFLALAWVAPSSAQSNQASKV